MQTRSIVLIPFVSALWACVEDRRAFIGTAQLLCVVSDDGMSALFARLVDLGVDLAVVFGEILDFRVLGSKRRRKV